MRRATLTLLGLMKGLNVILKQGYVGEVFDHCAWHMYVINVGGII